mmetsp:Transcript_48228/g.126092  ORF Transcript_48228/g.126092 Transcript_48228/m.126092 type:complete len:120 (-) Transcript_48228:445-804(-)
MVALTRLSSFGRFSKEEWRFGRTVGEASSAPRSLSSSDDVLGIVLICCAGRAPPTTAVVASGRRGTIILRPRGLEPSGGERGLEEVIDEGHMEATSLAPLEREVLVAAGKMSSLSSPSL